MKTSLLLSIFLLLPFSAQAQENLLPSSEDVYFAEEELLILDTDIGGDAFLLGGLVRVQEDIEQDLHIVGGQIDIDADVGDDVRVAGGDIAITGTIEGDLIVFGGNIHVRRDTIIEGNINVMGGEVFLDGRVNGDIMARSGLLHITGRVDGNTDIEAGEVTLGGRIDGDTKVVADVITVKTTASLANVQYWHSTGTSPENLETVATGDIVFDESLAPMIPHKKKHNILTKLAGGITAAITLFSLLSAALIAVLLVWFNKTFFVETSKRLQKNMWKECGIGIALFVGMPIAAVLLMTTLIGLPLGFFVLLLWGFTLFFALPMSGVVLAYALKQSYKKKWGPAWMVALSVGFYAFLKIMSIVPVVGWLVTAIIVCMCVGASAATELTRWQKVR